MRKVTDIGRLMVAMFKAADKGQPVTISYMKREKDLNDHLVYTIDADGHKVAKLVATVRTIEIHDIGLSEAGDVLLYGWDRQKGQVQSWRADRVLAYSVHRSAFVGPARTPLCPELEAALEEFLEELQDAELAAQAAALTVAVRPTPGWRRVASCMAS